MRISREENWLTFLLNHSHSWMQWHYSHFRPIEWNWITFPLVRLSVCCGTEAGKHTASLGHVRCEAWETFPHLPSSPHVTRPERLRSSPSESTMPLKLQCPYNASGSDLWWRRICLSFGFIGRDITWVPSASSSCAVRQHNGPRLAPLPLFEAPY